MDLVVETWDAGTEAWAVDEGATTVDDIDGWVDEHCKVTLAETPAFDGCGVATVGSCDQKVCATQRELCRALVFREMAQGEDDVVLELAPPSSGPGYRLQPQDAESRVALWQASQYSSMLALELVSDALFSAACTAGDLEAAFSAGSGSLDPDPPAHSTGELLASTLVEALENGELAAHEGARGALGIADRDRAAISNLGLAARLSWFDSNLSRLIGVQTHVGGVDGSALATWEFEAGEYRPDPTAQYFRSSLVDSGIGSQPECNGGCAVALETIRFSGAPFADIINTGVALDSLVSTGMGPRLRERLPGFYTMTNTANAAVLADAIGVTANDLEEARAWMRHEAEVFARPTGQLGPTWPDPSLPPNTDGRPRTATYDYDATTMARPTAPPSMHYLTAARTGAFWSSPTSTAVGGGEKGSPTLPPLRPERAHLFDYAHAVAREALAGLTSLPDEARGVLATLTQTAAARRALQVETCNHPDTTLYPNPTLRIRVVGLSSPPSAGDFLLVEGTTALRCATEGRVEGVPCGASFGIQPNNQWAAVSGRDSRLRAVEWAYDAAGKVSSLYVVRRRPDRSEGPGAYEPIAGIPLTGAYGFPEGIERGDCTTVPYDFVSGELSSSMFAMTGDLVPEVAGCGDFDLNTRLPLEDIIIDDGDPWEDSWAHHLQVAANASAHSDLLGQQLIEAGLEMDRSASMSVDRVQELCGVSINLDDLFSGPNGSLAELVGGSCTEAAADCSAGFECVGTVCVRQNLLGASGSFQRTALMECLGLDESGADATVPIVALGEHEVCLWRRVGSPEILCDGAAEGGSCPFPVVDPEATTVDDACGFVTDEMPPLGTGGAANELVIVTNDGSRFGMPPPARVIESALLGMTGSVDQEDGDETGPPGASVVRPAEGQCDAIRVLRGLGPSSPTVRSWMRRALGSEGEPFFSFDNVRYWAQRIGWRAYPLDFSEITLDGDPWADSDGIPLGSTGFPFRGFGRDHIDGPSHLWNATTMPPGSPAWPCAQYASGLSGATDSLFRSYETDCSAASTRAPLNWRMGRAVATLAALAGAGLGELRMPAYYQSISGVNFNEGGPQDVQDYHTTPGNWQIVGTADFGSETISGWVVYPSDPETLVWTSPNYEFGVGTSAELPDLPVTSATPMSFLSFGSYFADDDSYRAEAIARTLWDGMQRRVADPTGGTNYGFYGVIDRNPLGVSQLDPSETAWGPHPRNAFLRALLRRGDLPEQEYLNHGRNGLGVSNFNQLSGLFGQNAYDLGNNSHANYAHLFADNGTAYGVRITRRDLVDAMELMCEVAASVPNADVPPPAPADPVVTSMADLGSVQLYARRVAARIDDIASRQVVQGVPVEVVRTIQGDATAQHPGSGTYGDLVRQLQMVLRNQGNAPRDIAAALRDLSVALDTIRREQQIFRNEETANWLFLVRGLISATMECISAGIAAAGSCALTSVLVAVDTANTVLANDSLSQEFQNTFDAFVLRVQADFDLIEAKQVEMANAADEARRILGALRDSRVAAQSALAQALFADSDAAGRHYPVNTAMRRVYDINLQRYRAAHEAAQRLGFIARLAVEQRFGVDLEEQTCASLVEPPSSWAADVCNTTGVNYADLRNPEADVSSDAIRGMFVGDYVRRLEHYTESYRFDFPYSSGEDLMVISVRDDLLRPRGRCVEEAVNLLGASNDLTARQLSSATGDVTGATEVGWHVPVGGCTNDGLNCVAVRSTPGPRISVHESLGPAGPVPGRIAGQPPRGFQVTFAPGTPTDYTDDAAWVQELVLPAGTYRLSWYQKTSTSNFAVDARTTVDTPSAATPYLAAERAMTDGTNTWERKFLFFTAPPSSSGTLYYVGVFPQPMEPTPYVQPISVAGLQLENVTGTPAGEAFAGGMVNTTLHGPPLFVATTAAGWAVFDDCETSDPSAFQNAWNYRCANLCSGGFQSEGCAEGEEPETYCYWETVFSLDEERLVGRGDSFGGGFAFGNFNYRTGDIAVNVVGTGVRDCDGLRGDACYTTAGIPFSFSHGPSGLGTDMSAYTVRSHSGSLHPVHLFRGQIESGRALAAERYLTNPLSSADAALVNDYVRTELRGRPMSGTYRLILWDVPGFDFHRVEDVQILMRYRYFTRTGSALGGSTLMCEG